MGMNMSNNALVEQAGIVQLGSWVEVQDGDLREGWRIVSRHEADAMRRLISEETPLAKALLAHRASERVKVLGPERRMVTILSVHG
jgi:transcription elongation GreA/GreB family factor